MKWLSKQSIKSKLNYAMIFFIMIFLAFGIFTNFEINGLGEVTKRIYEDPLKVSNAAIESRVDIIKIQKAMRDVILSNEREEISYQKENIDALAQKVLNNLNILRKQAQTPENIELEEAIREIYYQWRMSHEQIIELINKGQYQDAEDIARLKNSDLVKRLEDKLVQIDMNSKNNAETLVVEAQNIEEAVQKTLALMMLILIVFFSLFFFLIVRSIVVPLNILQTSMNDSTLSGELTEVELEGDNEVSEIAKFYNLLINKLKEQFWVKDGQNSFHNHISGITDLNEFTQKVLNFLSRELDAGKAAFYIYDSNLKVLSLNSTFAYTEREHLSNQYALGEGIVGQVALEQKSILLRNVQKKDTYISTGLIQEAPLNIYAFPLIYEGELYGVIELASFEPFNDLKQEFLNQTIDIISINLYSAVQNKKIKELLTLSTRAQEEARKTAHELKKSNAVLEEQKLLLQQQTEELQQTNAELEDQHQLLQQQSEELQQTNSQLEEQQQLSEEQAILLSQKNHELDKSKKELENQFHHLEKANKCKSEFLANMSHELRTPLNSIILLSKLLLKNKKNESDKEELEKINIIHSSGQELLRLINDILDSSKVDAGKMEINKIKIHSNEILKKMRQLFEGLAEEKGIAFTSEDLVNRELYCDYDKVSQILRNLLSNAIKFTDSGFVTLRIINDLDHANNVIFTVIDTGMGISKENISNIFKEFQQGDGSVSRKYGGTGLGLSISKKLAKFMGGDISVASEYGKGSTFSFHLTDMMQNQEDSSQETGGTCEEYAITREITPTSSKVIMLIEDDEIFIKHIKNINTAMGFDTLVAKTGKEGLVYVKEYDVDGILLDLILPDMNGIDILAELKSTVELKNIPVHIISARDKYNLPQRMGAIGYKQKPLEEDEIVQIVTNLVHLSDQKIKRLLIVEDNKIEKEIIKKLMFNNDIEIYYVDTVQEAKKELERLKYDAIILDMDINDTGINICEYLAENKMEIPIIVYTSREFSFEEEKEIRKYVDSIILKTANSHERLLDEVMLFLHTVKENNQDNQHLISKTNKEYALRLDDKKILLVDDDIRNIFVLATALEEYGAQIIEAENGEIALKKLEEENIDLILMDIMMPIMDGFETMKIIRSEESLMNIPIIAITAKSLKEDREKCIKAGADDYITKPIDHDTLIRLVNAWINQSEGEL